MPLSDQRGVWKPVEFLLRAKICKLWTKQCKAANSNSFSKPQSQIARPRGNKSRDLAEWYSLAKVAKVTSHPQERGTMSCQRADEKDAKSTIADEVERYLLTGESDPLYSAWTGSFLERANRAHDDLRGALVSAVRRLTMGLAHKPLPETDTIALTRAKIEPMVRGLFPRAEQDSVLATLEQSVVFITSANIERLLYGRGFDSSAWTLASLYLTSLGAELLGEDAPGLVGLSEDVTCYVSLDYFAQDDPFADFIVHEVAHVFHNCKRATIGLRETRTKKWLLDIEYRKRETFAYACEAYARVLERAKRPTERLALAEEYATAVRISEERVSAGEVASIVRAAAAARNGWKVILAWCAPPTARANPKRSSGH